MPGGYEDALLNATVRGDAAMLQLLITAGAPHHTTTPGGESLLHLAAAYGQADAARVLVQSGLSIEAADAAGITPMQTAIIRGQLHMPAVLAATALEQKGILPEHYLCQLTESCLTGDFYTAHLIQTTGLSINATNTNSATALHNCALAGNAAAIHYLLKRGANPQQQNDQGKTPLEAAREAGQAESCAVLAAHDLCQQGITQEHYNAALRHAVRTANTERITLLKEAGTNLNTADAEGNTPVHTAVQLGQAAVLNHLHGLGANINLCNKAGMSPVFCAVAANHPQLITQLHKLRANTAQCLPDGRNLLQYAVSEGYHHCIAPIVATGAKVNKKDSNGNTLLHFCAAHGQRYCLEALLQAGADVHARNGMKWTALHYACANNYTDCEQTLIANGAVDDIFTAIIANDADMCQRYLRSSTALTQTDGLGCTPLHWAARLNRQELIKLLMRHGANATATDTRDRTPADCARAAGHADSVRLIATTALQQRNIPAKYTEHLHRTTAAGDTALLRLLIDAGADLDKTDKAGWPLLHTAVLNNQANCIPYLLQRGVYASATSAGGYSALHLAVAMGRTDCVQKLVADATLINLRTRDGCTPLHLAVRLGHPDCVHLLLKAGANVHLRNERGDTPLAELARWSWGSAECASALIAAGADLHSLNTMGESPLHAAAISGNKACLALFISAGANTKSTTGAGKTPRQLATANGHQDCARLLQEAESDSISSLQ